MNDWLHRLPEHGPSLDVIRPHSISPSFDTSVLVSIGLTELLDRGPFCCTYFACDAIPCKIIDVWFYLFPWKIVLYFIYEGDDDCYERSVWMVCVAEEFEKSPVQLFFFCVNYLCGVFRNRRQEAPEGDHQSCGLSATF